MAPRAGEGARRSLPQQWPEGVEGVQPHRDLFRATTKRSHEAEFELVETKEAVVAEEEGVAAWLKADKEDLFRACTSITLGNGQKTLFWHDNWTGDGPLKLLAPELYKIASRKNRSITLLPDHEDTIHWNLTTSGTYSAASAYGAQFLGSYSRFDTTKVWSANAEPKCKFFAWLALHRRTLTADMLAVRGWPHEPRCLLCLQQPETATRLCKDCPFTVAVWDQVNTWTLEGVPISGFLPEPGNVSDWWDKTLNSQTNRVRKRRSGRIIYTIWSIWKERNRRVFTGQRRTHREVTALALDAINQRDLAFAGSLPTAGIG
ncbi:uncharacterized protein [Aegilops tauschii subsp. strangulata]|uniref:uncharacterized protein n=1 Tax=Aegilops tauschii subsp. strangulata TaxID=200361 RepID=UPI003CC84F27